MPASKESSEFPKGLRNSLCAARSCQEILKLYFQHTGLSYADVARKGGFSSRSYPRDVTEGRRRLTLRSLPSLVRGLRVDGRLAEFFHTPYLVENPEESTVPAARLS